MSRRRVASFAGLAGILIGAASVYAFVDRGRGDDDPAARVTTNVRVPPESAVEAPAPDATGTPGSAPPQNQLAQRTKNRSP